MRPVRPIEEYRRGTSRAILRSVLTEPTNLRLIDLLAATAHELVAGVNADACTVSRVIGDVLILITERAPEGMTLLGRTRGVVLGEPGGEGGLAAGEVG